MEKKDADLPPILVIGTHRSGTTWAERMLALSPNVHYVHEPFAPMYERSWLRNPPVARFHHQDPLQEGPYLDDVLAMVALRPSWLSIAGRARGLRNWCRIGEEALHATLARWRGARALVKDPFLLLSAEWFAAHTGARPIVLVRHPAAFASSIKRLGWRLDVRWLLAQERLMKGYLRPFEQELRQEAKGESDLVDHACLVWRALNSVVARYAERYPEWLVVNGN